MEQKFSSLGVMETEDHVKQGTWMKRQVCQSCGSNDFVKKENMLECKYCHSKYIVDENKKTITLISTKEIFGYAQKEVQGVLFECPKCDSTQTKITGKKSYFSALGKLLLGWILAFIAPFIIAIKILIYIGTFRFDKVRKMIVQTFWNAYILWLKCWLIVLTFGIYNITEEYTCKKCSKKWDV